MTITSIEFALISCIIGLLTLSGTLIGVYVSIRIKEAITQTEIQNIKTDLQKKDSQFKSLEDWIDGRFVNLEKKLEEFMKALLELRK